MLQRGRKGFSQVGVAASVSGRAPEPWADLSDDEAELWRKVTASKPWDWFDAGSEPLLAQYCRVVVQSSMVGVRMQALLSDGPTDDEFVCRYAKLRSIQSKLSREIVALATRMRLTQQSRYSNQKAATKAGDNGRRESASAPKPWELPRAAA